MEIVVIFLLTMFYPNGCNSYNVTSVADCPLKPKDSTCKGS